MPYFIHRHRLLAAIVIFILLLATAVVIAAPGTPPPLTFYESDHRIALHALPYSDGTSILVRTERLAGISAPAYAQLRVGATSYEPGHTDCDPNADSCDYEFLDIPVLQPYLTGPVMTAVITTTAGVTDTQVLGTSDFVRHYVRGDTAVEPTSLDNNVSLFLPAGTLNPDSYLIIMNTFAPPGDPPPGHRLVSQAYSLRPSGAQEQTGSAMILTMNYVADVLNGADPHTLSIFHWDSYEEQWQDLESDPFGNETRHTKSIQHFGTYALMLGTTWRDTFLDYNGLDERENVRLAYGGRLALRSGYNEGYAVSVPITPTDTFSGWGQVDFVAEVPQGAMLTVDVLAADGQTVLLADVADGTSLTSINPTDHPSLCLRATLNREASTTTPYLDQWSLSWTPEEPSPVKLYLPIVVRAATSQAAINANVTAARAYPLTLQSSGTHIRRD